MKVRLEPTIVKPQICPNMLLMNKCIQEIKCFLKSQSCLQGGKQFL